MTEQKIIEEKITQVQTTDDVYSIWKMIHIESQELPSNTARALRASLEGKSQELFGLQVNRIVVKNAGNF